MAWRWHAVCQKWGAFALIRRARRMTYRFGEFEVDASAYEVRRRGDRVRLSRQPMDLLLLLLERRQELVSRDEIVKRLWSPRRLHRPRCRHPHGDSQDPTGVGRLARVAAIRRDRRRQGVSVRRAGRSRRSVACSDLAGPRRHRAAFCRIRAVTTCRPRSRASSAARSSCRELPRLLSSSRLLSLTGAGGVGKTRLAVRLAAGVVDDFRDGVWLVDLAPLSAPDLLAQTIANVLGVREGPQRPARDALLDASASSGAPARARQLRAPDRRLRRSCRGAAARGAGVAGCGDKPRSARRHRRDRVPRAFAVVAAETPMVFQPMRSSTPRPRTSSSSARARLTRPSRRHTATPEPIARICQRLDGIPLAIELAAARVVVLSVEQIEARLQDRFRLLIGGARTAVARQRTLEATVDWSYQLLSDVERQLLCRLSVFPASWTLEAAEKVCGGDGIEEQRRARSAVAAGQQVAGRCRQRVPASAGTVSSKPSASMRVRAARAGGAADAMRDRHFEFYFNEFRGARPMLRATSRWRASGDCAASRRMSGPRSNGV